MICIIRKHRFTKVIACFLAIFFLFDFLMPVQALASGPNQPEYTSFNHASVSELVNTATGDFSYNIPLLDIEGYPINITYNAGATMDQEASWVGLGWTLNPGVLNRTMRGLPDDFMGDEIKQQINIKKNYTLGAEIGAGVEIFGAGDGFATFGVSTGVFYNNYKGLGINRGLNFSLRAGKYFGAGVGVNITHNSQKGLTISPDASLKARIKGSNGNSASASVGVGTSYNTRSGMSDLSLSLNASITNADGSKQRKTINGNEFDVTTSGGGISFSASIPIGTSTYFPSIQFPRKARAFELMTKGGAEVKGAYPYFSRKGYYMSEEISHKNLSSQAYGYLYAHKGQGKLGAMHDFNRANDGMVSSETPNLPLTNQTYDIFMATAQGLSSMFRAHRSDVGTVYDNKIKTTTSSNYVGLEGGFGSYTEVGGNVNTFELEQTSGKWTAFDNAKLDFMGRDHSLVEGNYDFEEAYFRQSGEGLAINQAYYNAMGGERAVRLQLGNSEPSAITPTLVNRAGSTVNSNVANLHNSQRNKRGVVINYLNAKQARDYALEKLIESHTLDSFDYTVAATATTNYIKGEGHYTYLDNSIDRITHANNKEHHISEVSVTTQGGKRFVYGIPSYSRAYEERSFNVAPNSGFNSTASFFDDGLKSFNGTSDNSINNSNKKDGFFQKKSVPDYATSYLLTTVLSADYVDVSGNGPSVDDLGSYTKFNYTRVHGNYGWKQPYEQGMASFNAGFRSDKKDDRASYAKGQKEIWYLHSIETKNYIAEFQLIERADAIEANFVADGGQGSAKMYALEEIRLYARKDKEINGNNAIPLKTIHFKYSYSLCKGLPTLPANVGKLTLDEIYFTHGYSQKAWFSPYKFFYADPDHTKETNEDDDYNQNYDYNSYDRWGNYKQKKTGTGQNLSTATNLSNADFPYVNNNPNDNTNYRPNRDAAMWALHVIQLPSGGTVKIDYEADDYAYVQNKKAMQMTSVAGFYKGSPVLSNKLYEDANNAFGGGRSPNLELVVNLPVPIRATDAATARAIFMDRYMREELRGALARGIMGRLYYKCAVNTGLENDEYDFVTGYADIDKVSGMISCSGCSFNKTIGGSSGVYYNQAIIRLRPAKLKDDERGSDVNPISKATWQMVRTYLYKLAFPASSMEDDNLGFNLPTVQLLFSFIEDIRVMLKGVNAEMRRKGIGQKIVPGKSFVRLHNPDYKKIGGGHRVKRLQMIDEWGIMNTDVNTDYIEPGAVYGKLYSYTTTHPSLKDENGDPLAISSGVASYEPLIGGDENPFRRPIEYELKRHLYANDILYAEAPFGEVFFPSPSVIYSQVRVRDYVPPIFNLTVNGTGESVFEHYTAYDFPIKTEYTPPQKMEENSSPIKALFSMKSTYELAMSQGYSVVMNDMHGKEKAITVYGEGQSGDDFISRVEYLYKSSGDYHSYLDNRVNVLNEEGNKESNVLVNVDFDMVHDTKQTLTRSKSRSYQANVNTIITEALAIPLPVPTFFIHKSDDTQRHKMSVITKVVQKYGILEKTIAEDQQARIETKNELFDKETGRVLLSRVTNQYDKTNDHRSMTYPAHWAYNRMGPAYKNIDKEFAEQLAGDVVDANGQIQTPYDQHFVTGDEVMVYDNNGNVDQKYWVIEGLCTSACGEQANITGLFLIDRGGSLYNKSIAQTFRIIRSGRRNQSGIAVGNFTAKQGLDGYSWKTQALSGFQALNNTAQEFTEYARYQLRDMGAAECSDQQINPFVWGVLGNWKPQKSWVYNVERNYVPGNLKDDGYFDMKPFWVWNSIDNKWEVNSTLDNWQTLTENTLYHNSGFAIENRNEIGTYISQLATLNNTAVKAVANNARYREIINESFEDFSMLNDKYNNGYWSYLCSQNRIGLYKGVDNGSLSYTNSTAHTGKHSLELPLNSTYNLTSIFFLPDNPNTPGVVPVPYLPQGWERLQNVSFADVADGEEAGFVVSYWRRLGTSLDYDVNKPLKEQYDPVEIGITMDPGTLTYARKTQKSVIIDGWQKIDEIITFVMPSGAVDAEISLRNTSTTAKGYIDDIRIHPLHSNMVSHVYDIYTNRKVADLDDNNYATFYEYNEEGSLIRVKKETEKGIVTVQEARDFTVRN